MNFADMSFVFVTLLEMLALMLYQGKESSSSVSEGNVSIVCFMGRCILFLHNLIQFVLEVLIISLIVSNYGWRGEVHIIITLNTFFDPERAPPHVILDDDQNHGILLAHYFFFIYWIAHMMVFSIACLFSKLTIWQHDEMINENNGTKFQNIARFATFLVPSLSWFTTKYQYYFSLNLLFLKLTTLGSSIAYFYSLLNSGDKMACCAWSMKNNFYLKVIFFSRKNRF